MNISLIYLFGRALYRLNDFFRHWYVDATRAMLHRFISLLESLDETFAIKVTLRHFGEPLYKDYSILGRILGFIFRSGRILVAGVSYLAISILFAAIFLAWLLVPPLLLFFIVVNFPN